MSLSTPGNRSVGIAKGADRFDNVKVAAKKCHQTFAAPVQLTRFEGNPIISPDPDHKWESMVTTNPGAWYDQETGRVSLLYRAAGSDAEHVVRLGLATSDDGYNFQRYDQPAISPSRDGADAGCLEDPRIVKIDDYYYITYASRFNPPGKYWLHQGRCDIFPQVRPDFPAYIRDNLTTSGLLLTRDFKKFIRAGFLTNPILDDRDVILFPEKINGRYYMIHRPLQWCGPGYKTEFPAMWISAGDDLLNLNQSKLLAKAQYPWECKVGGNTPPLRTEHGWLVVYHAVGSDKYYRLGAMLLDLDDPTIVRYRTSKWIFQPEEEYETNGFYFGGGVVFPCGKVVIGDTIFVYYGAADKYVGLATCPLNDLLDYLLNCPAN